MKLVLLTLLIAVFATVAFAAVSRHSIIVSYPDDTPESVLDEAKGVIRKAGGIVTHEYKLIKAFAARTTDTTLETVRTLGSKYNALIEEDGIVTTQDHGIA